MGVDINYNPTYDLNHERLNKSPREPAAHQSEALESLHRWYREAPYPRGGLLVLPTGGGKTFTAMRFLATSPLSDGYKVLWLAHTHHLLEQAHGAMAFTTGHIAEPRNKITTRVVSGTTGHYRVQHIEPGDDVLFATLQTMTRALKAEQPSVLRFINAAAGKLFIVFDEAHHAPAASYRRFIERLRERVPQMGLLGLTATPTYTDERKRGWLEVIFPQKIIHEATAERLMTSEVLAKPLFEDIQTRVTPQFNERLYQRWLGTHRDLPPEVIDLLASNRERNAFIAQTYIDNRERFGRTIVFADRWFQCEALSEMLKARGVRAGAIYSHVDRRPSTREAREKRTRNHNAETLERFRNGDLDVLINIQMLTEGTDVPSAQTVFLTRQTTSRILMTQMIGRALRGPKFGGTKDAYVVAFTDNWRHLINFAAWDRLSGAYDDSGRELHEQVPLHVISIDLVRDLVRRMDTGLNVAPAAFLSMLPVGWYIVEYSAQIDGSDDTEPIHRPVLIYNTTIEGFQSLIETVIATDLESFEDVVLDEETTAPQIEAWKVQFFGEEPGHIGEKLRNDLVDVIRHVAQNGAAPRFFPFEERTKHDLDKLAQQAISEGWNLLEIQQALQSEFNRVDRFWTTIYTSFSLFKGQFDATVNRLLTPGGDVQPKPSVSLPASAPALEVDDQTRRQVKERDHYRCLACGYDHKRVLQVDHITSRYFEGSNILDNLQTLCTHCNKLKGTHKINFRDPQTDLEAPLESFEFFNLPSQAHAKKHEIWERYLQRTINWFYRCGAVQSVRIGKRGHYFYHWQVELRAGNKPSWLEPHLLALKEAIVEVRERISKKGPDSITIKAPGEATVSI